VLRLLQLGVILSVPAALPFELFDLDRHSVPKELVLHLTAMGAALVLLRGARRVVPSVPDLLLAGFLGLSAVSALFAPNWWLGFRALGLSFSSALVFWSARAVGRAGMGRELVKTLAFASVLGAVTGLLQAYGLWAALAAQLRSPGGTFGNRNFMAHYAALGAPLLVLVAIEARSRFGYLLCALGAALSTAALFLSRSRAAYVGLAACAVFLVVEGLWRNRLGADRVIRRRVTGLAIAAVLGVAAALLIPNQLDWRSDSPYLDTLKGVADFSSGSGRGRLIQFGNTLRLAEHHPLLGVGPGNWPVRYPEVTTPGDPAYDAASTMPTNPWPSSDWMAYLSERGIPAFVLLVLTLAALLFPAWRRLRSDTRANALAGLTLVAMLMVTAVVGSFDAVLLLPAPALLIWAAAGALAPAYRGVDALAITQPAIRRARGGILAAGVLLSIRSTLQIAAMAESDMDARTATLERAAHLDPGSYRIRIALATDWIAHGRCDRARPHALAAAHLFPMTPAPKRLLRRCGVKLKKS
jgi:O-antigen ligase